MLLSRLCLLQNVPQWSCQYALAPLSGGSAAVPAAALRYMAKTLSAGGQEFCASQPSPSGFCDPTAGITGLCASQPGSSSSGNSTGTFCRLAPVTQTTTMLTTLATPGRDCPTGGKRLTAEGQSSLVAYLGGFLPGFKLTVVQGSKAPLQCIQEYVSVHCMEWVFWQGAAVGLGGQVGFKPAAGRLLHVGGFCYSKLQLHQASQASTGAPCVCCRCITWHHRATT